MSPEPHTETAARSWCCPSARSSPQKSHGSDDCLQSRCCRPPSRVRRSRRCRARAAGGCPPQPPAGVGAGAARGPCTPPPPGTPSRGQRRSIDSALQPEDLAPARPVQRRWSPRSHTDCARRRGSRSRHPGQLERGAAARVSAWVLLDSRSSQAYGAAIVPASPRALPAPSSSSQRSDTATPPIRRWTAYRLWSVGKKDGNPSYGSAQARLSRRPR